MGQVDNMLREMAGAQSVQVVNRTGSVTKLARLVLVAEQFGFMYGDTYQTGGRAPKVILNIHRDPSPEAQRRAADNFARYPQAGNGGDLPGMQPGGKLKPLPDAAAHLELLKARINFDLTGKQAEKRMLMGAIGLTACILVLMLLNPSSTKIVIYALLLPLIGVGFLWNRKRNARFENVLRQAGLTPVQDGNGRTRYLPPGSQLPGQHNPFAQQASGFPQPGQAPAASPAPVPPGHPQPQPPGPQGQFPGGPVQQPVPQGQYGPYGGPQQGPYGQHGTGPQYGQQPPQAPPGQAPPQPQYYAPQPQPQPQQGHPQQPAQNQNWYQQGR